MSIDTSIMAELQDAIDRIERGVRDPDFMRQACIDMDREREELRRQVGELDIAVELIRDARDE
jgi:hypothetical protein